MQESQEKLFRNPSLLRRGLEHFGLRIKPEHVVVPGKEQVVFQRYPDLYGDHRSNEWGLDEHCQWWWDQKGWWRSFVAQKKQR